MNTFYAKQNLISFSGGNTGAQMGGWFRKDINSVADLAGVKKRWVWCRSKSRAVIFARR